MVETIIVVFFYVSIIGFVISLVKESYDEEKGSENYINKLKDMNSRITEINNISDILYLKSEYLEQDEKDSDKTKERCEYCDCLFTSNEVTCSHCGAPK